MPLKPTMAETVAALLRATARRFQEAGIETAKLDARLLLQSVLHQDHAALVANPDMPIDGVDAAAFEALLVRRLKREPVSRILGEREFYGRRFAISPAVLDPRPDSETLIEAALELGRTRKIRRVADLGTGSGILALTLLAEWPEATALATDASTDALEIAANNARSLGVAGRAEFQQADWWQGVEGRFDLIISNPPYIPEADVEGLSPEVKNHDPHTALVGGHDGFDCYRAIAGGAASRLVVNGVVLLEIGAGQQNMVNAIFETNKFNSLGSWSDLGGHVRVLGFSCD